MTTTPMPSPAAHNESASPNDGAHPDEDQAQREGARVALHRAVGAGEAAAAWVRELAGRQDEQGHGRVLLRAAAAIERASGPEVIPGSNGELVEELRHALAADVLLGATHTATLPELHPGERLALVAVCALAASMPGCAVGDLARELPLLADELDQAVAAGRIATAAGDARVLSADRPRIVLGADHADPLDRLAHQHVADRAVHAFEIALHYQDEEGRGEQACAEALLNALAVAGPGFAAAALLRAADDPALGLDAGQHEHLTTVAVHLDLDTVEMLGGAHGDGTPTTATTTEAVAG